MSRIYFSFVNRNDGKNYHHNTLPIVRGLFLKISIDKTFVKRNKQNKNKYEIFFE